MLEGLPLWRVLFTKITPTLKTDFYLDLEDFLEFFEARKSHASGAYESTIKNAFSICQKVRFFFDHSELPSNIIYNVMKSAQYNVIVFVRFNKYNVHCKRRQWCKFYNIYNAHI